MSTLHLSLKHAEQNICMTTFWETSWGRVNPKLILHWRMLKALLGEITKRMNKN
jgi:hypothetical protein